MVYWFCLVGCIYLVLFSWVYLFGFGVLELTDFIDEK